MSRRSRASRSDQRGFAALAAVIMICTLLTIAVLPASLRGCLSRLDASDVGYRAVSRELALACRDAYILALLRDVIPPETVVVGSGGDRCTVDAVEMAVADVVITTSGEYPQRGARRARTVFRAAIHTEDGVVLFTRDISGCASRAPPDGKCD